MLTFPTPHLSEMTQTHSTRNRKMETPKRWEARDAIPAALIPQNTGHAMVGTMPEKRKPRRKTRSTKVDIRKLKTILK